MLRLTRKREQSIEIMEAGTTITTPRGETITLAAPIEIKHCGLHGLDVQLGITAPPEVPIHRAELPPERRGKRKSA